MLCFKVSCGYSLCSSPLFIFGSYEEPRLPYNLGSGLHFSIIVSPCKTWEVLGKHQSIGNRSLRSTGQIQSPGARPEETESWNIYVSLGDLKVQLRIFSSEERERVSDSCPREFLHGLGSTLEELPRSCWAFSRGRWGWSRTLKAQGVNYCDE